MQSWCDNAFSIVSNKHSCIGKKRATVARPRACTLCRECIREEGWDKNVALRRVNDHFICKYSNSSVFTWLNTVCGDVQISWYLLNRIISVSLSPTIIYFRVSLNSSFLNFNFSLGDNDNNIVLCPRKYW